MPHDAVIHLIDDDDAVRHALAFLLAASGYAVRVDQFALAFLDALPTLQPGCVITDVRMPGMDGLELQRKLNSRQIPFPVIVLTGNGDVPLAVEAMKAGAIDFIEKPFDDEVLLSAVQTAVGRHARNTSRDDEVGTVRAKLTALSAREAEVFEALAVGHPNKVIAHELGISPRTVEVHRANVMTKMGAASLSELVRMAFIVRSASG